MAPFPRCPTRQCHHLRVLPQCTTELREVYVHKAKLGLNPPRPEQIIRFANEELQKKICATLCNNIPGLSHFYARQMPITGAINKSILISTRTSIFVMSQVHYSKHIRVAVHFINFSKSAMHLHSLC